METKKEDRENVLFTDKMIISFIIPIMLEKFLLRLSEIVDNIMTSQLGEVVISGLSLAGQLNIFVYNIFRGFVLGASILLSHLLGSRKTKLAQDVVYTMISVSILFSILITILFQLFGRNIIALFFGTPPTIMLVYAANMYPDYTKKDNDDMVEKYKEVRYSSNRQKAVKRSISSIIWTLAVVLYFVISFTTYDWHITWIIFLIALCIQSIIGLIFTLKDDGSRL